MRVFQSVRGLAEIRWDEGEKKHERNAKSFSIRAVGEENVSCVRLESWIFFKRSSGGNNDETMTRISRSFKSNAVGGGGGDEAGV